LNGFFTINREKTAISGKSIIHMDCILDAKQILSIFLKSDGLVEIKNPAAGKRWG
jgi:hypothetical protein